MHDVKEKGLKRGIIGIITYLNNFSGRKIIILQNPRKENKNWSVVASFL